MKLPLSWLREWVDLPADARELSRRLTGLGFEVEAMEPVAPPFSGVVVAEIVSVTAHPQADKLRVCMVNAGTTPHLQIVCGAPNARVGLRTALANVGAELPGGMTIKAAKLRGVESAGMLCSATELGLPAANDGIIELPADAPVGADLRHYLDLNDVVFEIGVTPNRGDAMSVLGIARELAAASGQSLRQPAMRPLAPAGGTDSARPAIRLVPGSGAARFASRVIRGVNNQQASPAWLRERLQRAGQRSISAVVDVTNYVMLELGQPMHAYDLAKLRGDVVARRAGEGEVAWLLDGRELALTPEVLVIADDGGVIGLAGIMGGERTAMTAASTDLLLEVAWFEPSAIAGRARRHGLFTDASQRFERGVDPSLQERALARVSELIIEIAGGQASPADLQQITTELPVRRPVRLRSARLRQLLGMAIDTPTIARHLQALGMNIAAQAEVLDVTPPSWRFDIHIEADLIEEVARTVGLDAIPEQSAVSSRQIRAASENQIDERVLLQLLAARGYQEVINFGFVDPTRQRALFGETRSAVLKNPIASDLAAMRESLWIGLLANAAQNQRRQQERCKLFEMAACFISDASGIHERRQVAGLVMGARLPEQWGVARENVDFFDLKSDVEALLALAGPAAVHTFAPVEHPPPALHPGRCAEVLRDGARIGLLGELHPTLVQSYDLAVPPMLFEIDYQAIATASSARYQPVSHFPQIRRDLSFTVDAGETFSRIAEHVSVAASAQLKELRIFDLYSGKGIESGRKSVALGLILQDLSRTLTDKEADAIVSAVVASLQSGLNARLRE